MGSDLWHAAMTRTLRCCRRTTDEWLGTVIVEASAQPRPFVFTVGRNLGGNLAVAILRFRSSVMAFRRLLPLILLLAVCCQSKERALSKLREANIAFTPEAFCDRATAGDVEAVTLFIRAGMAVDEPAKSDFRTALIAAAGRCEADVVEVLLKHGASVKTTDQEACTPLLRAVGCGSPSPDRKKRTVKLLVDAGSDLSVTTPSMVEQPLAVAVERGNVGAAEVLIAAGAGFDARNQHGMTPLQIAESKHTSEGDAIAAMIRNAARTRGPKTTASSMDREAVRKELASLRYDLDERGFIAACRDSNSRPLELFLAAGMDPSVVVGRDTPLGIALDANKRNAILLLRAGARVTSDEINHATHTGDLDLLDTVLASKPDVNQPGLTQVLPLEYAARLAWSEGVERLIKAGADPNRSGAGYGALQSACLARPEAIEPRTIRLLLDHGANPNGHGSESVSPLALAARAQAVGAVQLLIARGAHLSARDSIPATPARSRPEIRTAIRGVIAQLPPGDQQNFLRYGYQELARRCGPCHHDGSRMISDWVIDSQKAHEIIDLVLDDMPVGLWQLDRFEIVDTNGARIVFTQDSTGAWSATS